METISGNKEKPTLTTTYTHTHIQIIRSECNQNEKIKKECWQNRKNVNRLLPADKTCLANILSPHIASLCAWRIMKKISDGTEKKKNENRARMKRAVEEKKRNTKQKAKWKCEYIEMRSTILFYIVWHTSHDFSSFRLAFVDVNRYSSTNVRKDNCMGYIYSIHMGIWRVIAYESRYILRVYHLPFATWKCGFLG